MGKLVPKFPVSLTVWHIGGVGQIGPAQAIMDIAPNAKLVTFDARKTGDRMACFSDEVGQATLRINENELSSSLLEPAAQDEQTVWEVSGERHINRWRDVTRLVSTEEVDTTTVDVVSRTEPAPDVLSIDVQGVEYRVLYGAKETLPNVLAVIAECEFHPIYKDQHLFSDQMNLLRLHGFRLSEIKGQEYWHPCTPAGQGFLTVGEAVWIRWDIEHLSATQLMRLAVIAFAFNLHSYVQIIVGKCLEKAAREAA